MNKTLKYYKNEVHRYLDGIWIVGSSKRRARSAVYSWLATQMKLTEEEAHVAKFNKKQCQEAIKILRPKYIQLYGKDLEPEMEKGLKLQTTCTEVFETAHILPKTGSAYEGLYSRTYKIKVVVEGQQVAPYGMIIPTEQLKDALKAIVPDRQFIFYKDDVVCMEIAKVLNKYDIPYLEFPYEVVAENMIQYLKEKLDKYLKEVLLYDNIKIVEMELSAIKDDYSTRLVLN